MPEHNISSLKQRNNLPTKINKTSLSVEQLSFKAKTMAVKTQSHTFWCICWWMMFNFIIKKCFVRPINSAFFKIANKSGMKDVFVDPRSDLTFFETVWQTQYFAWRGLRSCGVMMMKALIRWSCTRQDSGMEGGARLPPCWGRLMWRDEVPGWEEGGSWGSQEPDWLRLSERQEEIHSDEARNGRGRRFLYDRWKRCSEQLC